MKNAKILIVNKIIRCKSLSIENTSLSHYFSDNGYSLTSEPLEADYIIINTCGALNEMEDFSIKIIKEYLNRKSNSAQMIILGCLTKINPELLNTVSKGKNVIILRDISSLDTIFQVKYPFSKTYPITKSQELTTQNINQPKKFSILKNILFKLLAKFCNKNKLALLLDTILISNRNLIEIASGCTENCSYCAIKIAKGKIRSVPIKNILTMVNNLKEPNKIISLVAQDCGAYGIDLKTNIYQLLKNIHETNPNLSFEITSVHPKWLLKNKQLWLDILKNFNIAEISIPLQSGAQNVLKNMKRSYIVKDILSIIQELRKASPKTHFRTHIIAGFPGENLLDFLKNFKVIPYFDSVMVNPYEDRPMTASSKFKNKKAKLTVIIRRNLLFSYALMNTFWKLLKN